MVRPIGYDCSNSSIGRCVSLDLKCSGFKSRKWHKDFYGQFFCLHAGWVHSEKTAGKWQKCNLISGMASVASNVGWLWTGWISPAPVQMSGMLSVRRAVVIVCGLFRVWSLFPLTSRFFVNSQLDHFRAWIPACSLTSALLHRCFPSNLCTTTQGAIVKLRGASSELCTLFIFSV